MAINLMDLVKDQLTDGVLDKVTGLLGGEDKGAVSKGLMAAAPALLASFMDKGSTTEGASSLFNMLGDGSELSNLTGLLGGGSDSDSFVNNGLGMANNLLGDKAGGVMDMVSSLSGLGGDSSNKVLGVAGSLLGGVLGKQKSAGLDAGGLMNLLGDQGSFLEKFAPQGMASVLGLASLSGVGSKIGDLASGVLEGVGNAGSAVAGAAGSAASTVGNVGKGAVDAAGNVVSGAADLAGDAGKAVLGAAGSVASGAAGLAGNAADKVGDVGKAAYGAAGNVASGAADLAGDAVDAGGSLIKKILPIAILALLAIGAFFFLKGCGEGKGVTESLKDAASETTGTVTGAASAVGDAAGDVVDATGDAASSAVDAVGDAANALGDFAKTAAANTAAAASAAVGSLFSWTLPNDAKLNIPKGGFENNLLDFIQGGKLEPGKYYAFDRIYFETGSANLNAKSQEQVDNVSTIMAAYPEVKFLLRGHTDNKGSANGNLALSKKRAESVKAALVAKGVDAARVGASGIGSAEPTASNDTAEGRAKNRRIDASILK